MGVHICIASFNSILNNHDPHTIHFWRLEINMSTLELKMRLNKRVECAPRTPMRTATS